jgi:ABC-type uncharacterized transport system permease subunit
MLHGQWHRVRTLLARSLSRYLALTLARILAILQQKINIILSLYFAVDHFRHVEKALYIRKSSNS